MNLYYVILTLFLTMMLLSGDYLIKFATTSAFPVKYLIIAGFMWVASIPGWFFVVSQNKISIVGMLFAIFSIIGTTLIGVLFFKERLNNYECLGLAMAIISSILLTKRI